MEEKESAEQLKTMWKNLADRYLFEHELLSQKASEALKKWEDAYSRYEKFMKEWLEPGEKGE